MPPDDFSMLKNVRRTRHFWKSHTKTDVKQLFGFHYQRNLASKFARIYPSGLLRLVKYLRSITGIVQNDDIAGLKEMLQN